MAEQKHAVVRTDLMAGTDVRSHLVSVKYMGASDTATEIDNGNVVKVGELVAGEREIHVGTTPATDTELKDIVLIASPEIMYEVEKRSLTEFYNEAGSICRGYRLHSGDIFSVTAEAIDGTASKGSVIELMAGTKLKAVDSATGGSTTVGFVEAVEVRGKLTYYVIRVA